MFIPFYLYLPNPPPFSLYIPNPRFLPSTYPGLFLVPKDNLMEARILLLRGIEDVNGPPGRLVTGRDIVALRVLCERVDQGDLLRGQLDVDKVLLDAGGVDGLGDDAVAADLRPGKTEKDY